MLHARMGSAGISILLVIFQNGHASELILEIHLEGFSEIIPSCDFWSG